MQKVNELLSHVLASRTLIDATLSGRRHKKLAITKVTVRPVMLKKLQYQFTDYYPDKVMHRNLYPIDCQEEFVALLMEDYRQAQIFTPTADYHILLNRQNKAKILIQPPSKQAITTSHNRRKNYIIASNPAPTFLTRLGLANQQGRVYPKKMGKFKQINRFLEMVDDVVDHLDTDRELRIVDFGCGKSYLTFALYYYLHEQENLDVNIVGLDIKEAVVDRCNTIAADLGWSKLSFQVGDIKDYQSNSAIDMVVSLHACDTATDMALAQAVAWQSKVILAAPCCQHELSQQIDNPQMKPLLKHGILRERLTALITDSLRASALEIMGYHVQVLEFVDLEHTAKNLLIRAVRNKCSHTEKAITEYLSFRDAWSIQEPYLEQAMGPALTAPLRTAQKGKIYSSEYKKHIGSEQ